MKRREFIAGLGGAVVWPLAARAQQAAMPVVGVLSPNALAGAGFGRRPFIEGLAETGYVEDRNVALDYRFAESRLERLPALAAELVRRRTNVIYAPNLGSALAAKAATQTIPIVFVTGGDPIKFGLVASLNRPGENITGVAILSNELIAKRLEMLRELVPSGSLCAFLVNPTNPFAEVETREVKTAAAALGLRVLILNAKFASDYETAFATLAKARATMLIVAGDALFFSQADELVALAARHAVPAMYAFRATAMSGGLMSYGADENDAFRLGGVYVGRILKGEKPSDLPVQQSTKVRLVINTRTARALGITFPLMLLGRADEVIE
jgi:putative tryptophan/tyrosine transport system substrate-binding protein